MVVEHARQAERSGKQPRRFRREIEPRGIGGPHHRCKPIKGWRREAELLHHHVERAEFATMAPEYVLDIEGRGVEALRDLLNFGGRHEQEDGCRINEPSDQPRARNAIDFWTRSRDPDGAAPSIALRNLVGRHGRKRRVLPTDVAAFEDLGSDIAVTEPGGSALAKLLALVADDHNGLADYSGRPILNVHVRTACCTGDQTWVRCEVLVNSDIDEHRRIGSADETKQFIGWDRGVR